MTTLPSGRTHTALWKSMFRSSLKTDQPNRFGRCRRFIAATNLDVEYIVVTPIAFQIHRAYPRSQAWPIYDRSGLVSNNVPAVTNPRSIPWETSMAMCHRNRQRCLPVFATIDGSLLMMNVCFRLRLQPVNATHALIPSPKLDGLIRSAGGVSLTV